MVICVLYVCIRKNYVSLSEDLLFNFIKVLKIFKRAPLETRRFMYNKTLQHMLQFNQFTICPTPDSSHMEDSYTYGNQTSLSFRFIKGTCSKHVSSNM